MWIKLDDQIAHHPKLMAAGPVASWLFVAGLGYCNKFLTDGFIPSAALGTLGGVKNAATVAEVLVRTGIWEKVPGGFKVHDFHDYNPTAAAVKMKRRKDRERKRNGHDD
jgi:hypothetical protein